MDTEQTAMPSKISWLEHTQKSDRGTYMFSEEVSMGSKLRIGFPDKLHHILHCP